MIGGRNKPPPASSQGYLGKNLLTHTFALGLKPLSAAELGKPGGAHQPPPGSALAGRGCDGCISCSTTGSA